MRIRLNRDPIKIAAATLTPVLLTLILAKAAGPLDDNEAVPAAEPASTPTAPEMAAKGSALEPVQFGHEASAVAAATPLADADVSDATSDATGAKSDVVPRPAYPARVAIAPVLPDVERAAHSVPPVAAAEPVPVPGIASAPQESDETSEVIPADPPAPVSYPAAPIELAAASQTQAAAAASVSSPVTSEAPVSSEAPVASTAPAPAPPAPAPIAAEDSARVAAALDRAQAETAKAEALASGPAEGPRVLPETRLALADWNYSLPPSPSRVSGFADSGQAPGFGSAPAQAAARTAPAAKPKSRLAQTSARKPAVSGTRRSSSNLAAGQRAPGKYRMVGSAIEFQLPVQVDGEAIGQLTMHVVPNQPVALHLKELVSLFADQLEPQVLQALNASSAIDRYITFERLREAGIDIRYDAARDQIRLAVDQP